MIELEDLVRTSFNSQMTGIYTCIPCVVIANDKIDQQRLDVQPAINKKFKNDQVEEHPPILSVPLVFPSSSTSSFTFPIEIGDTVLCVFSQRGLDTFKENTGKFVVPTDYRKFDKRDAIAIPGIFPFAGAVNSQSNRSLPHSTKDAVIGHNLGKGTEVEVRLKANGDVLIKSPTTVTVECTDAVVTATATMTITVPTSEWTGNMTFTGDITFNGNMIHNGNNTQNGIYILDAVNMNTHVHTGVTPGLSDTGPPKD